MLSFLTKRKKNHSVSTI